MDQNWCKGMNVFGQ